MFDFCLTAYVNTVDKKAILFRSIYFAYIFGVSSREPNRLLPIANISRIMRRKLPETAKVAKDARDLIQECVSEFIGFVTSEAR